MMQERLNKIEMEVAALRDAYNIHRQLIYKLLNELSDRRSENGSRGVKK